MASSSAGDVLLALFLCERLSHESAFYGSRKEPRAWPARTRDPLPRLHPRRAYSLPGNVLSARRLDRLLRETPPEWASGSTYWTARVGDQRSRPGVAPAQRFNVYVAWNWIAIFFSPDASFVVVTERSSEEEARMAADNVRWDQYPNVAGAASSGRSWLTMQVGRNLANHTVETYGRSMEDFLRFADRAGVQPEAATREQLARYVRDLLARTKPRQPKVVHLESGAGLSNATVLLRLSVVRLFYDHLVVDGVRPTNPVGRMHWRKLQNTSSVY